MFGIDNVHFCNERTAVTFFFYKLLASIYEMHDVVECG